MKRRVLLLSSVLAVCGCGRSGSGTPFQASETLASTLPALSNPNPSTTVVLPDKDPDAKWKNFQATCAVLQNEAQDLPHCTCVLVGPRAVLTARHCVKEEAEANTQGKTWPRRILVYRKPGTREADCLVSPDVDLALCILKDGQKVSGIDFENVGRASVNQKKLLLTGFGCHEHIEANASPKFSSRRVTIENLPSNSQPIETGNQILCDRDSGGPGYILLSAALKGPRIVVGINAKNTQLTRLSESVASKFVKFLDNGETERPIQICGVNTPAGKKGCRSLS